MAVTERPPGPRSPALVEATRVEGGTAPPDGFTYTVLLDAKPARDGEERRDAPRRRTRLRSGKVVDARGMFVTECLVHDLSATGMRLRLPPAAALPPRLHVYDDQSGLLREAEVSWRRDGEAGLRLLPPADTPLSRTVAADMRRKFYKLPR
jgi:hypothetical protein